MCAYIAFSVLNIEPHESSLSRFEYQRTYVFLKQKKALQAISEVNDNELLITERACISSTNFVFAFYEIIIE